ncbi:hypothetical protein PHYC_00631 [Phycisphaerales bacterium]|nr:hypothetical protein PHYC_00631 [Phycisphaerales bacterium]
MSGLRSLLSQFTDVETIECQDVDSAIAHLERARRKAVALPLALIFLDDNALECTRREAASELELLLESKDIAAAVRDRLYSAPLPVNVRVALEFASGAPTPFLKQLLDDTICLQPSIVRVREAWDRSCFAIGHSVASEGARLSLCDLGYWRRLVEAHHDRAQYDLVAWEILHPLQLVTIRTRARLAHTYPLRQVVLRWMAACRPAAIRHAYSAEPMSTDDALDYEQDLLGRRKRSRSHSGADEALARVSSQQRSIVKLWRSHKFREADRILGQLIQQQRKDSTAEQLGKTLSKLGMQAMHLLPMEKCLSLTRLAIEANPHDVTARTQLATQLAAFGFLTEALAVCQGCIVEQPKDVVPRCLEATILKQMGRLRDALEAFQRTASEFPDDPFPLNGAADVLKVMGYYSEALEAYQSVTRTYGSTNVVSRTGEADVLKLMGHLGEALHVYDEAIRDHPGEVVAWSGKADVLMTMDRLPEALVAYQHASSEFTNELGPRSGIAEVLRAMGRLPEALAEYRKAGQAFPGCAMFRSGAAHILKLMGRLHDALAEYEQYLLEFPNDEYLSSGRISCLLLLGSSDAVRGLCPLPADLKLVSSQADWIAIHMLGMLELRSGDYAAALRIFSAGKHYCEWADTRAYFAMALAATYVRQRQWLAARNALNGIDAIKADVLRLHVSCAAEDVASARKLFARLGRSTDVPLANARDTIARRYRLTSGSEAVATDDDVFESEARLLLAA